jgi:alpha-glucosidase (family GH31 glycosyl hydrolase)
LHYRLFAANDAVQAWRACLPHIGHPQSTPPEALWRKPIWTTWARFKMNIHQERVLRFADEIIAHGYPYGVMEIDDRWQAHYGDIAFDPKRFPHPRAMVDELHSRGFAVTCWVMPFVNPDADCFDVARSRGYLLKQDDGSLLPVRWWQGNGHLLDVANPDALHWFGDNLRALQQAVGLDGYKFDAGEANFAGGRNLHFAGKAGFWTDHTHRYVEFVAANFSFCEVRSGWGNQRAPIFFRQWDKWSQWGKDNGLESLITGAFALGLAGYPFVLPDMVGGNAYFTDRPSAELLTRWSQANALLPAIQFSLAPWDFGDECARLCRAALDVRERYLDRIATAMQQAASSGDPIIRPVWWLASDDERAQVCDDEFLLSDDVLVAPVVRPRQRARDVCLPNGQWQDVNTGQVFSGPAVLTSVPAPLDTLLVYNRI